MNTSVTPDQQPIKYLATGQLVRVLARPAPDQIVVEIGRTYEDDPDEVFFDGTKVVKAVYDKPPVEAIHPAITALEERRGELQKSVLSLQEIERTAKRRVESLKVYDQLARVEDFLSGKITHYVIYSRYGYSESPVPRISTPQAEISGNERHGDMRLLVLFGKRDRTMEWVLNSYSDGSGSNDTCIPCCSLEEAQQRAREILAASLLKYKVPDQNNCQHGLDLAAAARGLAVPLPVGFEEALRRCNVRNRESEVERKRKELSDAVAALQAAQGPESAP